MPNLINSPESKEPTGIAEEVIDEVLLSFDTPIAIVSMSSRDDHIKIDYQSKNQSKFQFLHEIDLQHLRNKNERCLTGHSMEIIQLSNDKIFIIFEKSHTSNLVSELISTLIKNKKKDHLILDNIKQIFDFFAEIDRGIVALSSDGRIFYVNILASKILPQIGIHYFEDRFNSKYKSVLHKIENLLSYKDRYCAIRMNDFDNPVLIEIKPLNLKDAFDVSDILLLNDPSYRSPLQRYFVMEVFGLSPAEAELAIAFCRGATVQTFADDRGYSKSYIQTLSKRTLARIGVKSKQDLIRRILAYGHR